MIKFMIKLLIVYSILYTTKQNANSRHIYIYTIKYYRMKIEQLLITNNNLHNCSKEKQVLCELAVIIKLEIQ